MEDAHSHLPHIGLRNLKSAFSAALCAGIYYLIDRNPTFACIGAVYGMGNDMGHSWQQGGNRLIGTIIGGFLGMGLFWCYLLLAPAGESRALLIPLTFVGVVVLICLSQMFRWPTAVQPGSVVLCNLPANCTAVGVPAEVVRINNKAVNPADDLDQQDLPDVVAQRIRDLDRRIGALENAAQGDTPPTASQIAARQKP